MLKTAATETVAHMAPIARREMTLQSAPLAAARVPERRHWLAALRARLTAESKSLSERQHTMANFPLHMHETPMDFLARTSPRMFLKMLS
jgi:hypothetical protein